MKREYQERSEDYVRFEHHEIRSLLLNCKTRKMLPALVRVRAGDMLLWDRCVSIQDTYLVV